MSPSEAQAPGPRPLVVGFVNRLSGGQLGAAVFAAVQNLGLDAVHDLSGGGPRCVTRVQWVGTPRSRCHACGERRCKHFRVLPTPPPCALTATHHAQAGAGGAAAPG